MAVPVSAAAFMEERPRAARVRKRKWCNIAIIFVTLESLVYNLQVIKRSIGWSINL